MHCVAMPLPSKQYGTTVEGPGNEEGTPHSMPTLSTLLPTHEGYSSTCTGLAAEGLVSLTVP